MHVFFSVKHNIENKRKGSETSHINLKELNETRIGFSYDYKIFSNFF